MKRRDFQRPRVVTASLIAAVIPFALTAQQSVKRAPSPPPSVFTLTYTDYAFNAPATIPSGVVTIRAVNRGKHVHHGILIRLDSGKTARDLMKALSPTSPFPKWAIPYGGPQDAGSVTLDLPAGNYVWLCAIPDSTGTPHFVHGMMRPMTVGPAQSSARPPKADIVVTEADYTWAFSRPITRGIKVLKIVDPISAQPHEMAILQLGPGQTVDGLMQWGQHPAGPIPAQRVTGITTIAPGHSIYATVNFTPGRYVVLCFEPDAKDGKPHVAHGMVKEFTVE